MWIWGDGESLFGGGCGTGTRAAGRAVAAITTVAAITAVAAVAAVGTVAAAGALAGVVFLLVDPALDADDAV
jgi:hypothetical protein